jgi:mono/diheme cytochrome c family protein
VILALTFRTILIVVNILALLAIIVIVLYKVLSVRHTPDEASAQNLTPFHDDETLEGRHLERVLRWALAFSTIVAIVLPLYWLLEPSRQSAEAKGFEDRSIERGAVLFANSSMPAFDNTTSLQCANCHGTDAGGSTTSFVLTKDSLGGTEGPVSVTWQAPALNTVLQRYTEAEVKQIITYGRPGTPMPPWGVAGGGPKNDQSIDDLVAYLQSIQLTPAKAHAQAEAKIKTFEAEALGSPDGKIKGWVATAQEALTTAQKGLAGAETPLERTKYRIDIANAQKGIASSEQAAAHIAQLKATAASTGAQAQLAQGELIFMTQCARCHTMGWSYYDPTNAGVPAPGPMGGGALGPSLIGTAVEEQFPGTSGIQKQFDWINMGVDPEKPYGVRGISSGKMPHFDNTLSKSEIMAVLQYERSL